MKELSHTKVTVRIRKVEDRKEWYVYLESYPVFVPGKKTPQRIREYINRSITTVEWDKKRAARTNTDGTKTYKPKRNDNGVIICRSEIDQETMLYADGVRKLRQREYDNADLYSDTETAQAEQKERSQQNFIEYFSETLKKRHRNSSLSIVTNWQRTLELLKSYSENNLLFSQLDNRFIEGFRAYLLSAPCGGNKSGTISHNTAATYFSIFKAALKQAFVDGYLTVDLSAKVKGIQEQESRREYLTVEELNTLAGTPCERDILKRAALFSALTGLRHCDIQKMCWKEIQIDGEQARLHFTQQKTKGVEYMPIPAQALQLCGEQGEPDQLIFEDLPDPAWISKPLKRWIEASGISKRITFHQGRHSVSSFRLRTSSLQVCLP